MSDTRALLSDLNARRLRFWGNDIENLGKIAEGSEGTVEERSRSMWVDAIAVLYGRGFEDVVKRSD